MNQYSMTDNELCLTGGLIWGLNRSVQLKILLIFFNPSSGKTQIFEF